MVRFLKMWLVATALIATACSDARLPEYELSGSTMGTTFNVRLVDPAADVTTDELQLQIVERLQALNEIASTWLADSELSEFNANRSTDWIGVSAELCHSIEQALEISRLSDGAFDVTVGPLVNLWGFGPEGDADEPPADETLRSAMASVGHKKLETHCEQPAIRKAHADLYVDLSGWAKGDAVDALAEILEGHELENYLVEIGGELRVRGHNAERRKWAIAVEAPSTLQRQPHSVVRVTNTSVATSGDYRNFFDHDGRRYSHTIDARTGRPVSHDLAAVTVVNESAAFADAMATALLVLGPQAGPELAETLNIAGYFLIRDASGIRERTTPQFELLRNQ